MNLDIKLERSDAEALLKRLYAPQPDREGHSVYIVDVNLARVIRVALHDAINPGTGAREGKVS